MLSVRQENYVKISFCRVNGDRLVRPAGKKRAARCSGLSRCNEGETNVASAEGFIEAINYALKRRDGLTRFCDDGRVEISNRIAPTTTPASLCLPTVIANRRIYIAQLADSNSGAESPPQMFSPVGSCKLASRRPH